MKFIKLTKKDDGHPIWLNTAHIMSVFNKGTDHGGVEFVSMARLEVAETADVILGLLLS